MSGIIKIDGQEYTFDVADGKRTINGVDAEEFVKGLPVKTLLRIVAAGMDLLNEE